MTSRAAKTHELLCQTSECLGEFLAAEARDPQSTPRRRCRCTGLIVGLTVIAFVTFLFGMIVIAASSSRRRAPQRHNLTRLDPTVRPSRCALMIVDCVTLVGVTTVGRPYAFANAEISSRL